ncbi:MAG: T9SS type A sorting domain-containing protein [Saprospiraceae bacterium]|nr:T9SS type A sorting domain-containing protein [Saprospiraceae bacterium]
MHWKYCDNHYADNKSIAIWAKDYNLNSEDNCTPKDSLKYFFLVNNVLVPSLTLDCSNIGINKLRVYVRDEAGNLDYCEVSLDLQDPNHVCGTSNLGLSGKITTTDNRTMKDVTVIMERNNPAGINQSYTDSQGGYSFSNLTKGADYQIKASYNQNHINGVSTQDIVMIQKHILGIQLFDNAYKYIAADANNSNTITAADIAEIRKLILGITNQFTKNESWRFVPKQTVFNDPNNPWPYTEQIKHQELLTSKANDDFYAVKIGDLSGNATPTGFLGTASRSNESYTIAIADHTFTKGQALRIPVFATEQMLVSGMQMELEANANGTISGIESGVFNLADDNYLIHDNRIKISYTCMQDQLIKSGDVLFTILVHVKQNGSINQIISLNTNTIAAELYDNKIQANRLKLDFDTNSNEQTGLKLYQNAPNPFDESTSLRFELLKADEVQLNVYNLSAELVYSMRVGFTAGKHEIQLNQNQLNGSGIFIVQMKTSDSNQTQRIIRIQK